METDLEGGGRASAYLSGKPARECFSARTSADGRFLVPGIVLGARYTLVGFTGRGSATLGQRVLQQAAAVDLGDLVFDPAEP